MTRVLRIVMPFVLFIFVLVLLGPGLTNSGAPPVKMSPARAPGLFAAHIDGKPPAVVPRSTPVIQTQATITNKLPNVPAFTWCYGCANTAAAMIFGYYDRNGYPNMYAGPANKGVCPLNNEIAWPDSHPDLTYGESPLAASHIGYDGRTRRGHVEDYWNDVNHPGPDPFISGGWAPHSPHDCTGDFMGTSQSEVSCNDGDTRFYVSHQGFPVEDYQMDEPTYRDGGHGMKLFAQSRGYNVQTVFNQLIEDAEGFSNSFGFTWENYMTEINAGRPVLIFAGSHAFVGFGYSTTNGIAGSTNPATTPKTMYIRTTWDNDEHTMPWGGSYGGQKQWAVSVIRLANAPPESMPDVSVQAPQDTTPSFGEVYDNITDQTMARPVPPGGSITYTITVKNNAAFQDTIKLNGTAGDADWTVIYFQGAGGTTNITTQITSTEGRQEVIPSKGARVYRAVVTPRAGLPNGRSFTLQFNALSQTNPKRKDAVRIITSQYANGIDPNITPSDPGITATRNTGSSTAQIVISKSAEDPYGCRTYQVYRRCIAPPGAQQKIADIAANGNTTYVLNNNVGSPTTPYQFSVRAFNGTRSSSLASTNLNNPTITPQPAGITARRVMGDATKARIVINKSPDDPNAVTRYRVYRRCLTPLENWVYLYTINPTNFDQYIRSDTDLAPDKRYTYGVRVHNHEKTSALSVSQLRRAPVDPNVTPQEPELVAVRNAATGPTSAKVTISRSPDDPSGCTQYWVYRQTIPPAGPLVLLRKIAAVGAPEYTFDNPNIDAARDYRYMVQAVNGDKRSERVIATLTDPAITPRPPGLTVGDFPGSGGTIVAINITKSPDDPRGCTGYILYRQRVTPESAWTVVATGHSEGMPSYGFEDGKVTKGVAYRYKLLAVNVEKQSNAVMVTFTPGSSGPAAAMVQATAVAARGGNAHITVTLSTEAQMTVEILNIAGRVVGRACTDKPGEQGTNTVLWDRRSAAGTRVPAGQYLVRVSTFTPDGGQCRVVTPLLLP